MSVTPCFGSGTGRKEGVGGSAQCLSRGYSVGNLSPAPTDSDLRDRGG